uniref:Undecaprenyl-phosphate glucose phosphotransferase n=1 Tax=Roseihalotalea indica TaxID=2867963 RepID=A0AA49PZ73_9BACT|nr:undecaprenyl-phosphate glucose phosphotransferase [Tunicatimonas sp. TK19036]
MENLYRRVRNYQYTTFIPLSLLILDGIVILGISDILYTYTDLFNYFSQESFMFLSVIMAICWALSALFARAYQVENLGRPRKIIMRSLMAATLYSVLLLVLVGSRMPMAKLSEGIVLYMTTIVSVVILKLVLLQIYRFYRHLSINRRNVIVVGCTPRGVELMRYFKKNSSLSQKLLGFFDTETSESASQVTSYLGGLDQVKHFCQTHQVHEIYYALDNNYPYLEELRAFADENFIFLGILPHIDGIDYRKPIDTHLLDDNRIPVITSRRVPLSRMMNVQIKRVFDILFSSVVLAILSVTFFPIIALAIRISSPGPILFKQLRPGRNNRLFWCYKFRTMRTNSDGNKQATKNDSRITRVGALLRKTSLDELPQFYNVLRGDMSVVGPRPNLIAHLEEYSKVIKEYPLRHWVTPGITGYAQVNGYRGETRETYQMAKRVEYDLLYMENWSLKLDMKIIWQTVANIVKGEENAY